jgi:hypothetical protein
MKEEASDELVDGQCAGFASGGPSMSIGKGDTSVSDMGDAMV